MIKQHGENYNDEEFNCKLKLVSDVQKVWLSLQLISISIHIIDKFRRHKQHCFNAGLEELPDSVFLTLHKHSNKIQPTEYY